MDKFVAETNIEHLGRLLATEVEGSRRQTLLGLLAKEKAKLAALRHQALTVPSEQPQRGAIPTKR